MSRHVVTFHYTLRDPEGRLLDTSVGGEPISYLEGVGQIIEGLEEQLNGVVAGTKLRAVVPAEKGYGIRDESQVHRVVRSLLPVEGELKPGDRFQAGEDRFAPVVTVVGVEGAEVLLDANHPLAGVELTFDVEVVSTRPATAEEVKDAPSHDGAGHGGS